MNRRNESDRLYNVIEIPLKITTQYLSTMNTCCCRVTKTMQLVSIAL